MLLRRCLPVDLALEFGAPPNGGPRSLEGEAKIQTIAQAETKSAEKNPRSGLDWSRYAGRRYAA